MKINRTISVDLDTWTEFMSHTNKGDYSTIIDGLLAAYNETDHTKLEDKNKEQLQRELQASAVKLAELSRKIKQLEAENGKADKPAVQVV